MMDSSKMCFFIAALVLTAIAFLKDVKSEGSLPQICTNRVSGFPTAPEKGGSCNWQVKGVLSALNWRDQPSTTQPWKTTTTRILVDTAVKIKQTGFSESFGRSFSGVSASHKQNCTAGNRQTEKGKSWCGLPFFFLNRVWLLHGFSGYLIVWLIAASCRSPKRPIRW